MEDAGLTDASTGVKLALRGKDGRGASGDVFWGDASVFGSEPELFHVSLPNGSWVLAGVPVGGWSSYDVRILWLRLCGGLLTVLVGLLVYLVSRYPVRLHQDVVEATGQLRVANDQMHLEVIERKRAESALRKTQDELEMRVDQRTADLLETNGLLRGEIAERKRAETALNRRAVELTAVNEELEAFSYSISHDLRAPLRSIDGFSQALLEDYAESLDAPGEDYLRRVRKASQRMGQLIDGMLKLSRVTRGEIRMETIDLTALAWSVVTELQEREPDRQVSFAIGEGVVGKGDANLLQVALGNLLGNAWKFTSERPRAAIEFGVTEHEGHQAYFVRDDGVGFDMAYVGKLFGPFQRLHALTEFEGMGIGLATVQRIINRHGGRVWAESVGERGATFYFTLEQ